MYLMSIYASVHFLTKYLPFKSWTLCTGEKIRIYCFNFFGRFFFAKKEFGNLIGHTCGVVFYELIGNIHVQISEASFFASKLWNNFEVFKVLQKCPYKGNLVHFLLDIYLFQFIKNFCTKLVKHLNSSDRPGSTGKRMLRNHTIFEIIVNFL